MKKSIRKIWRGFKKRLKAFKQARPLPTPKHLILYDGYCNLCHSLVVCILNKDKKGVFFFAPLQGTTAKMVFQTLPSLYVQLDSLILVENYQTHVQKVWIKGKAVLRISGLLGGWYLTFSWMALLPGFVVNPFYMVIAKRRFRLFGTTSSLFPDTEVKKRFLE